MKDEIDETPTEVLHLQAKVAAHNESINVALIALYRAHAAKLLEFGRQFNALADKIEKKAKAAEKAEPKVLTPEEAEAAYDAAPAIPLPPGRVDEIVKFATAGVANRIEAAEKKPAT